MLSCVRLACDENLSLSLYWMMITFVMKICVFPPLSIHLSLLSCRCCFFFFFLLVLSCWKSYQYCLALYGSRPLSLPTPTTHSLLPRFDIIWMIDAEVFGVSAAAERWNPASGFIARTLQPIDERKDDWQWPSLFLLLSPFSLHLEERETERERKKKTQPFPNSTEVSRVGVAWFVASRRTQSSRDVDI